MAINSFFYNKATIKKINAVIKVFILYVYINSKVKNCAFLFYYWQLKISLHEQYNKYTVAKKAGMFFVIVNNLETSLRCSFFLFLFYLKNRALNFFEYRYKIDLKEKKKKKLAT